MRLDDLYLVDIIEANEAIERMLSGISFDEFAAQEPLSPAGCGIGSSTAISR